MKTIKELVSEMRSNILDMTEYDKDRSLDFNLEGLYDEIIEN